MDTPTKNTHLTWMSAISVAFILVILPSTAEAASRYFVGSLDNDTSSLAGSWEDTDNWSTTPCGSTGASLPGTGDVAFFAGTCGNTVTIRSKVNVKGIVLSQSFTGTLLMGTGSLTVGTSGIEIGSGSFIASGSGVIRNAGSFTQTGGSLTGLQTTMTLSGSLSITEESGSLATVFSSTGTIIFDGGADQNFIIGTGTTATFENITLQNSGGATADDIIVNSSGALVMSGSLTVTTGNFDLDTNNVALAASGAITIADAAQATLVSDANITASGSVSTGAAGSITLSGSMTLTLDGIDQTLDTNTTDIPNLVIASGSGTTLQRNEKVSSSLQVNTGSTLTLSSYTLAATGSTITIKNYGTIAENTGKIHHTPSQFIIANSGYQEIGSITPGTTLYFSLTEGDENISGTAADTVSITVTTGGGDSESVTLTENGNATNVFRGSITTASLSNSSPTAGNSILEAAGNVSITALFGDAQDGIETTDTSNFAVAASTSSSSSSSSSGGSGGGGGSRRSAAVQQYGTNAGLPGVRRQTTGDVIGGEVALTPQAPQGAEAAVSLAPEVLSPVRGKLAMQLEGGTVVFRDIPEDAWYSGYTAAVMLRGIASGYRDSRGALKGEFGPGNPVLYGEIAKMALESGGYDVASVHAAPSNPSARRQWSSPYIRLAEDLGLLVYREQPDVTAPATRGAVIQTVLEALGLPLVEDIENPYSDLRSSHKHGSAILTATSLGIISGDTDRRGGLTGTVRPNDPVNRAETSKIFAKLMELGYME